MLVKFKIGKYLYTIDMEITESNIKFVFPYSKDLVNEVSNMEGARWHGFDTENPQKYWTVKLSDRNWFQIKYLMGQDVYAKFDSPLIISENRLVKRPLYDYQEEMVNHNLTRHTDIWACEMGLGKSLAAIEVMERLELKNDQVWYIGPKNGVRAFSRELIKWNSNVKPEMLTYEELTKRLKTWEKGFPAPKMVIFDESSKIKTPTAQRSQAAKALAEAVREEYKEEGTIILMTGTPSHKSPADWWHQCEVACPGYIREGDINKFRRRLCITKEGKNAGGGVYNELVTWLDDSNKCEVCGKSKEEHNDESMLEGGHKWVESRNEVAYLYKRMKGLVLVKFKKDCLSLPEKQYEVIKITPTVEMLRTAKLITETSRRAIEALTLLRELSDGFQYEETETGRETCPLCRGTGTESSPVDDQQHTCSRCGGHKDIPILSRTTRIVGSPKDQIFSDYLDEYEDIGRFIVWGGFTGTLDRLVKIAHEQGWATLRVDGQGYKGENYDGTIIPSERLLCAMDASDPGYRGLLEEIPRLCYVGHPKAGGMALTLTASPIELYYSNDFSGEARIQSEDRFHRAGMDNNRGALIVDLILLKSDQIVLDNLKKKRDLQSLTLGELRDAQ